MANRKRESVLFRVNFSECFRNRRLGIGCVSSAESIAFASQLWISDNDSNCDRKVKRNKKQMRSRLVRHSHDVRLFLIEVEIKLKTGQITPAGIRAHCSVWTRKHLINWLQNRRRLNISCEIEWEHTANSTHHATKKWICLKASVRQTSDNISVNWHVRRRALDPLFSVE